MLQTASIAGPALGGVIIAVRSVGWAYVFNAISFGFVVLALVMMREVPERPPAEAGVDRGVSMSAAIEGLRFVRRSPLMWSTMVLDFLVTFFASATALLPIFAQDILHVGARGYGWLFAAPAVGAFVTSAALVPLTERINRRGATLLWAVVGHGAATIVFGLSRSFWLTFTCLALTGATDTFSTVIRKCDSPARNARPPARTDDRDQHGVLHGWTAAWRIGGWRRGQLVWRSCVGHQWRHRLPRRDRLGRRVDAGDPSLSAGRRFRSGANGGHLTPLPARIRLISDTHGLLRPEIAGLFAGVDLIVHAGDVGGGAVLDALASMAPVEAVYGNVDDPHDPAPVA